uniref:Serine peptidase inhibitor Kazal type 4 n=1 Tax=Saimiri boliviensis boliviensis TaxID=39432 RepID=A0A2K6T849_SAIBB
VILGIGSSPHLLWMLEGTDRWPLPGDALHTDHPVEAGVGKLLEVPVSAGKLFFSRMPICEHMVESPTCSQTSNLVCGTDGVTYTNECQLCLARIKTKQDIQITKDGKC